MGRTLRKLQQVYGAHGMGGLARFAAKAGWEQLGLHPLTLPLGPAHLEIEVAGSCNLRCVMCPRSELESQGCMSPESFRAVIDGTRNLYSVGLGGFGEPLLNPNLEAIIRLAAERRLESRLTTNGMLLDCRRTEMLLGSGIDAIWVTLAGATAATDERIRPGVRFQQVVSNLAELVRRRYGPSPRVGVSCVCLHSNVGEVAALLDLAERVGVDEVNLTPLVPLTRDGEAEALSGADKALLFRCRAEGRARSIRVRIAPFYARRPLGSLPCNWPWTSAFVQADGRVTPCLLERDFSFGDGRRPGLRRIWNSYEYRSFREGLVRARPPLPCRRHCYTDAPGRQA